MAQAIPWQSSKSLFIIQLGQLLLLHSDRDKGINIEHWWNDVHTGIPKCVEKNLSLPLFITIQKQTDLKSKVCDRSERLATDSLNNGIVPQV
jgi:hypothetical protein